MLLDWLLANSQVKRKPRIWRHFEPNKNTLDDDLFELNNRRPFSLPVPMPPESGDMIKVLRSHFADDVTKISRVLSYHFPEKYLFYRVSKLEREIFTGFEYFADIEEEFKFEFSHIGRKGFERYLLLNRGLLKFFEKHGQDEHFQDVVSRFLYEGLGKLFLEKSDYHRYWIMATKEEYFESLDNLKFDLDKSWSGRKEMQAGDLVFMYRMAPRKAITNIFRIKDGPKFDPVTAWDGFWVDLEPVGSIEDISFSTMRADPVLSRWSVVRRHFQGVVATSIPHAVYNRLLSYIPEPMRVKYNLKPEPQAHYPQSGSFTLERDFDEQVIRPLLKRWDFQFQMQRPCRFQFGTQLHLGYIDFYVEDERGPLTIFEDKLRIINENGRDLELAVAQAKSYSMVLGLSSFVVASPEGLWVYSLNGNRERFQRRFLVEGIETRDAEIRELLLSLRSGN